MMRFAVLVVALAATSAAAQPDTPASRAAATHPGPGDRIFFHVLREPLLTDTVTVDERGEVVFPKIGVVRASSLTIGQLRDSVRVLMRQFLRDPAVELIVLRRVAVNGEVVKPDLYQVSVGSTLRDAIAMAGGLTETASGRSVYIVRQGARIHVPDWQVNDGAAADLRSGDQVVVGRRNWWAVNAIPAISAGAVLVSLVISLAR